MARGINWPAGGGRRGKGGAGLRFFRVIRVVSFVRIIRNTKFVRYACNMTVASTFMEVPVHRYFLILSGGMTLPVHGICTGPPL